MDVVSFRHLAKYSIDMDELTTIAKALADQTRIRLLLALSGGELCACQLQELVRFAPSTLTAHLGLLVRAGLAASRKDGRWVYYRLADKPVPVAAEALAWVLAHAARQEQARADKQQVKQLRKLGPQQVCCLRKLCCPNPEDAA
jgi:ArsR family transcriptional regulator, arsenate/arsenite/antimonite-responsive transcriptional repressor